MHASLPHVFYLFLRFMRNHLLFSPFLSKLISLHNLNFEFIIYPIFKKYHN